MKEILIVGAGGMGRELYSWILSDVRYGKEWIVKGFLVDEWNEKNVNGPINNYNIPVYLLSEYQISKNDVAMLAVGDPYAKRKVVENVKHAGLKFESFVHSSVLIAKNVKLGIGTIVCPNVVLSCETTIGDYVIINIGSTIGHDSIIGDFTTLSGHVDITGDCCVDENVFMGSHAALVPNTKVEKGAKVAAGSIGVRKVREGITIIGVPGKKFEIKK